MEKKIKNLLPKKSPLFIAFLILSIISYLIYFNFFLITKNSKQNTNYNGTMLFKNYCASCHTYDKTNSYSDVGPNLNNLKISSTEIKEIILNGKGNMPKFNEILNSNEVDSLLKLFQD